MTVILKHKPVMTVIFAAVHCLCHAPQKHGGNGCFLRCAFKMPHYFGRLRRCTAPKIIHKFPNIVKLLLIRLAVNAENRGNTAFVKKFCNAAVCGNHKFLNYIIRKVCFAKHNINRFSVFVKHCLCLGNIEVDCAAAVRFFVEDPRERTHKLKRGKNPGIACAKLGRPLR